YVHHDGTRRTLATPRDERTHRDSVALEGRLHGPIEPVPHPPRQSQIGRPACARRAEEHALDATGDDDAHAPFGAHGSPGYAGSMRGSDRRTERAWPCTTSRPRC